MIQNPTHLRLSLDDVPEPERVAVLRDVFGRGVMNLDFQPLTDNPRMEVDICLLPGVAVTHGWNSPHIADSGSGLARENDDFALVWGTSPGKGKLEHLGREGVGDNGSAILISCADRVVAETRSTFHHLTVRLQRSVLLPVLPDAESALMQNVPRDNEALRLLTLYVSHLGDPTLVQDPGLSQAVATHVGDLVALAIGTSRDAAVTATDRGLRAARLLAIKRWSLARLGSPDLNVSAAAIAASVSTRYVQLLFRSEGTTFSAFVHGKRLELAHRRLSNPRLPIQTIGAIAFGCGFGDLSYFDRSFRAAYGESPSDTRFRSLAAHS